MKPQKTEFDQLFEECHDIVRKSPEMHASMLEMRATLIDVHRLMFGDGKNPGFWHGVEYLRGDRVCPGPRLSELTRSKLQGDE